jgi:two-component system KDP operon response regulator KdpE
MAVSHTPNVAGGKQRILVVEDDVRSQRLVRLNLEPLGYQIIVHESARGISRVLEIHDPALIVLDLRLPDGDGFAVCQTIREISTVPIIFLSAYGQAADRVHGFELGADDYLVKPYDGAELAARIDAVLRRVQGQPLQRRAVFESNGLKIDYDQKTVVLDDRPVHLTRTEYRLLAYLAQNIGQTLVADALLTKVWGAGFAGDYPALHLYISRLRRKLNDDPRQPRFIVTRPGIGYHMPLYKPALLERSCEVS